MRSRSNSASAAKTWKTSLPPGVVVSIASCRLRNPIPRSASPGDGVDQVAQRAAEPIQLPHDKGVAGAQLIQELLEDGPVGAGAAGRLGEHSIAAGALEGVDLELWLLIGGGDAGIAEQVTHAADRLTTLRQRWLCDVDFGHGFWTPAEPS
jgi:hypothetical protein